ncbi:hypothetical protein JW711_00885 [Candidatus Woesearchaeota archaeon]|nr:hypothetical protein [Candidatus Woesearchaeota archaeon]
MAEEYKPQYVPGEIVVLFHREHSRDFALHFGEALGYSLKEEEYPYDKAFIFCTEKGKEPEACSTFARRKPFVAEAVQRDQKLERILRDTP